MARRSTRSISLPVVLGSVTIALAIALLVGWTLVILQNLTLTREVVQNTWLLVAGIVSLAVIIGVIVLLSVFLIGAIQETRRQTTFIDSVTHELRSPLAEIKLGLDTLARADLPPEQREPLRRIMLDAVDRLVGFVDDVLEASRLAHGRGGSGPTDVELAVMVQRCSEFVTARHHVEPNAVRVDVPADLRVHADRTALETVLKNLLDNAVKYSNPPVSVEVVGRRAGEQVELEVRDRGIGIPKGSLKRIFDRFYRVPGAAVGARHGTGLGLFVVSALVRYLGGRIEARSDGPEKGTIVRLTLPAGTAGTAVAGGAA